MTRKDQIAIASCAYGRIGSSMDFEAGAIWADRHPDVSSLWHDANKIPIKAEHNRMPVKAGHKIIYTTAYNDFDTACIPSCLRGCKLTQERWNEFVKENDITRWAYADDLLPITE